MTKLKFNLVLGDDCALKTQDITGFTTDNATGFYPESTVTVPKDSYKITQGYFKTVVLYNKYGLSPIIVNPNEPFVQKITVDPDYQTNFPPTTYDLSQDGVFTIKRIFVISKTFYDAESTTGRFDGRVIFYSDGTRIFKVIDGVAVETTVLDFAYTTDLIVGMITNLKIVSTCFINECYLNIINALIKGGLEVCSTDSSKGLKKQRDYLYMVLEAIKYYKEKNDTSEIQRIIESTNTCGGICKELSTNDCGCNG